MLRECQQVRTVQYTGLESDVDTTPEPVFLNDGPHPSVPTIQT